MRSEPDGSKFEVFATGIRNLQEFSFDEYGNLISVDNDGDHQGETERLVYIPNGSDSGWRSNWQYGKYTDAKNNRYNVWMNESMFKPRFAGQAAHIIPPVAAYHSGPSGMVYNPGTALSDEWKNYFFVSSFPGAAAGARIYGFKLKEDGAGFALVDDKVLLRGILTVGLKFGPDGALYLADWITGWDSKNKGRIWKLDAPAAASSPMRTEVRTLIAAKFDARSSADLTTLLRHVDMRIRQKAQFELVRRGDVQPLVAAANGPGAQAGARSRRVGYRAARAHGERRREACRAPYAPLDRCRRGNPRAGGEDDWRLALRPGGDANLVPLLADSAPRARFFAAEALGRIAYKPAAAPIVTMLAANDDKDVYLRHAGSLALSRIGDTAALGALSTHPSRGVRIAAIVALRRLRSPEVARFVTDSDDTIVLEAARAINDDGSIEAALPALARLLGDKRSGSEPLVRRAISANLKIGSADALARVAAFAADAAAPQALRVEATAAIGVWTDPSPMDRVDGIYLGQAKPRDAAEAQAAVLRLMQSSSIEDAPAMKIALADAAGRLGVQGAAPILLTQLRSDTSFNVRVAALKALQALKVSNMDEVMKIAVADADPNVRRAALGILPSLPLSDAAKVESLTAVIRGGAVNDQQAGFEVLGTLKSAEAEKALGSFFDELVAGKVAPAVQLDLVDAMQANGSPALAARLDAYRKTKSADSLVLAFRDALLQGGSADRGRETFVENPAAQCTRCHTVRNAGSDVGPNLAGVATRLTREQILESLLEPSARIAAGYGTVGITLKNGKRVDGTLRDETATDVGIIAGTPPAEQRIAKSEIAEQTNPISAMPPVGLIVKPREVRDLVAYLSDLEVGRFRCPKALHRRAAQRLFAKSFASLRPPSPLRCKALGQRAALSRSSAPSPHPSRSTTVILAARRAGSQPASRPIAPSRTAAPTKVDGSRGSSHVASAFRRKIKRAGILRSALEHRPDQASLVHAGLRLELLRAADVHIGRVEVALAVDVELMHAPEPARKRTERAPRGRGDEPAVEIELEEFLRDAVSDPQVLVLRHHRVVRALDVRPDVEELPVLIEDLDARVGAVGDVEPPRRVDRNRVHRIHVARARLVRRRALLPPGHQILPVLVELHDAGVGVTVGHEERPVGQPRDVGRPREMLVVVPLDLELPERHDDRLAVVGHFEDLVRPVVHEPDMLVGVVGIDQDLVRADETLVVLFPGVDHLAVAIDDVEDMVPAWMKLGIARREAVVGGVARRCEAMRRAERVVFEDRKAAALEDEDLVRALGKNPARRTDPEAGAARVLRPVGHEVVRARFVAAALLLRDERRRRERDGDQGHDQPETSMIVHDRLALAAHFSGLIRMFL